MNAKRFDELKQLARQLTEPLPENSSGREAAILAQAAFALPEALDEIERLRKLLIEYFTDWEADGEET